MAFFCIKLVLIILIFPFSFYTAEEETGVLSVHFGTVFPISLKNGLVCDQSGDSSCDPFAVLNVNGKEFCRTRVFDNVPDVHVDFNLNCTTGPIPKNSNVLIQLWDADDNVFKRKDLMNEWSVPPSEFNVGLKQFIGDHVRKIKSGNERNELSSM